MPTPALKYSELRDEVSDMSELHSKEITSFPLIVVVDGKSHVVTGWRLGQISIQLTTGDPNG